MENIETLRKRLLYQSQHRGIREMDLLLGEFALSSIREMDLTELQQFKDLLALPDQDLCRWLFEQQPLPPQISFKLGERIKAFSQTLTKHI